MVAAYPLFAEESRMLSKQEGRGPVALLLSLTGLDQIWKADALFHYHRLTPVSAVRRLAVPEHVSGSGAMHPSFL